MTVDENEIRERAERIMRSPEGTWAHRVGEDVLALLAEWEALRAEITRLQASNDRRWATLATQDAQIARLFTELETLRRALELALDGIPDPMHPSIPPKFSDRLTAVKIVLMDALGHDDPGNVTAARARLQGKPAPIGRSLADSTDERSEE